MSNAQARAEGVTAAYDAALARKGWEDLLPGGTPLEAGNDDEPFERPFVARLGEGSSLVSAAADWNGTISLVERAAATIRAYERRFEQLNVQTRALVERTGEEQSRLQSEIEALEARLRESEERAARAEMAARDEAFYRWEADRRLREAEARLGDAEDFARQAADYLRRVHCVLAEL